MEANAAIEYRLRELQRRLERVENLEPAVMNQAIRDMKDAIADVTKDVSIVKRLLLSFVISFSLASATLIVLIFTAVGHTHP